MAHGAEKIVGKAKKNIGKMTGDRKLEAKGKAQEEKAKAKDALGL